jgi:hypothetical protein
MKFARMMGRCSLVVFGLVTAAASPSVAGSIVSTTGAVTQVAPPPSVQEGARQSDTQLIVFNERSDFALTGNVSVNLSAPGTANSTNSYNPSPATIPSGTLADIYLFHSDPVSASENYVGTATFNTPILGVIATLDLLNATDASLGHPGTLYPTGQTNRGLESPDSVILSADRLTLTLNFTTTTFIDEIRVITSVPEPPSLVLGAIGAGALLAWCGHRHRRRATV